MADLRISYTPRPDVTPEAELNVLAGVYKFVLEASRKKKGSPRKPPRRR